MLLGLALLSLTPFAVAQNNLGELLDAGAKKISGDEFKQEVAQHTLVGSTTAAGGRMELMYANSGVIQGRAEALGASAAGGAGASAIAPIDGVWNIDDSGKVCTSIVLGRTFLPFRCQYWFKYKDEYFIADSEERSAKVLRRTVKQ